MALFKTLNRWKSSVLLMLFFLRPVMGSKMDPQDSITAHQAVGFSVLQGAPIIIASGFRFHYAPNDRYAIALTMIPRTSYFSGNEPRWGHNTIEGTYLLNSWKHTRLFATLGIARYRYVYHDDVVTLKKKYYDSIHGKIGIMAALSCSGFEFNKSHSWFWGDYRSRDTIYLQISYLTHAADHPHRDSYESAKETGFFPAFDFFGPWAYTIGYTMEFPLFSGN